MTSKTKTPPVNRIAEFRRKRGLSQQGLADLVGSHWITISKLERGKMQLTTAWLEKLSEALHTGPEDLFTHTKRLRTIFIEGVLDVGGRVMWYDVERPWSIETDDESDRYSFWSIVEGESLWPIFHDGDVIKFTEIGQDDAIDHLGRLCILEAGGDNSQKHPTLGFLDRGSRNGLFDIRPMNLPPIRDRTVGRLFVAVEARFRPEWMKKIHSDNG